MDASASRCVGHKAKGIIAPMPIVAWGSSMVTSDSIQAPRSGALGNDALLAACFAALAFSRSAFISADACGDNKRLSFVGTKLCDNVIGCYLALPQQIDYIIAPGADALTLRRLAHLARGGHIVFRCRQRHPPRDDLCIGSAFRIAWHWLGELCAVGIAE